MSVMLHRRCQHVDVQSYDPIITLYAYMTHYTKHTIICERNIIIKQEDHQGHLNINTIHETV